MNGPRLSIQKVRQMKAKLTGSADDSIARKSPESTPVYAANKQYPANQKKNPVPPKKEIAEKETYSYRNENRPINNIELQNQKDDWVHLVFYYADIVLRHKLLILTMLILVMTIAYFYTIRQPEIYETNFDILINNENAELVIIGNKPIVKNPFDINAWLKIAASTQIMAKVVEKLSLDISPYDLKGMIDLSTQRNVENIVHVSVTARDAEAAAAIGEAYFISLNEFDREELSNNTNSLVDHLKDQIRLQNEKLSGIDREMQEFYKNNNISSTDDFAYYIKKVEEYRNQLAQVSIDYASVQANIANSEAQLNDEESSIINQTTYSEPLKVQLMNLQVELARNLTKYNEAHPKIIGIKRNIENVKSMIEQGSQDKIRIKNFAVNPIKSQLMKEVVELRGRQAALQTRKNKLESLLASFENKMERIPGFQDDLDDLKRRKSAIENLLAVLQQRLYELQLNTSRVVERLVLLDEIKPPSSPSSAKLKMNLILAAITGLALGIGLAYALEMIDNRIKSVYEFETLFNTPVIGIVNHMKDHPLIDNNNEANVHDFTKIKDNNNSLAVNFRYSIKFGEEKLIAIVSGLKGEGKTINTFNLALNLAADNLKVLLVDTDFWKHKMTNFFLPQNRYGFSTYLSGQIEYEKVIKSTPFENLKFIGAGPKAPNASKLFQSKPMREFCYRARQDFDIVLFDTPALLMIPEIMHLFKKIDSSLAIVQILSTTKNAYKATLRELSIVGIDLMGVILNDLKTSIATSNYFNYYKYGYYKKYYEEDKVGKKSGKRKPKLSLANITGSIREYFIRLKKINDYSDEYDQIAEQKYDPFAQDSQQEIGVGKWHKMF